MHILFLGYSMAREFAIGRPDVQVSIISKRPRSRIEDGIRYIRVQDDEVDTWLDAVARLDKEHPIDRVAAFGESEQLLAGLAKDSLGIAPVRHADRARLVTDKGAMRRRLAEAGLNSVDFIEVDDQATAGRFAGIAPQRPGFIVKPLMGTSSNAVSLIGDGGSFAAAIERAKGSLPPRGGRAGVLLEEYKRGREFSVEALSEDGQHYQLALTQKFTDWASFAEVGHCVPATVSDDEWLAIQACVNLGLTALEVSSGPTHTEVILADDGAVHLVETHTRFGGHGIPALVEDSLGIDLISLAFSQLAGTSIAASCSEFRSRMIERSTRPAAAVWFGYVSIPGTLVSVQQPHTPHVDFQNLLRPGAKLPGGLNRATRVIAARSHGHPHHQVVERVRRAAEATRVQVEIPCHAQSQEGGS